jgi:hypothetical protein
MVAKRSAGNPPRESSVGNQDRARCTQSEAATSVSSNFSMASTFDNLSKYKMMVNPKKCVFGASSGKLLGYMVSS